MDLRPHSALNGPNEETTTIVVHCVCEQGRKQTFATEPYKMSWHQDLILSHQPYGR